MEIIAREMKVQVMYSPQSSSDSSASSVSGKPHGEFNPAVAGGNPGSSSEDSKDSSLTDEGPGGRPSQRARAPPSTFLSQRQKFEDKWAPPRADGTKSSPRH
ncbi:unnamed protein product [Calypogeia fissa]